MARPDPPRQLEVWMQLTDERRKLLLAVMAEQGVSGRELAIVAGYRAPSYMHRVLRGEIRSLPPARAVRVAKYLHMPVEAFFLTKSSPTKQHSDRGTKRPAATRRKRRVA